MRRETRNTAVCQTVSRRVCKKTATCTNKKQKQSSTTKTKKLTKMKTLLTVEPEVKAPSELEHINANNIHEFTPQKLLTYADAAIAHLQIGSEGLELLFTIEERVRIEERLKKIISKRIEMVAYCNKINGHDVSKNVVDKADDTVISDFEAFVADLRSNKYSQSGVQTGIDEFCQHINNLQSMYQLTLQKMLAMNTSIVQRCNDVTAELEQAKKILRNAGLALPKWVPIPPAVENDADVQIVAEGPNIAAETAAGPTSTENAVNLVNRSTTSHSLRAAVPVPMDVGGGPIVALPPVLAAVVPLQRPASADDYIEILDYIPAAPVVAAANPQANQLAEEDVIPVITPAPIVRRNSQGTLVGVVPPLIRAANLDPAGALALPNADGPNFLNVQGNFANVPNAPLYAVHYQPNHMPYNYANHDNPLVGEIFAEIQYRALQNSQILFNVGNYINHHAAL